MKILFINSSEGLGGAEMYSLKLSEALKRVGHDVHAATPVSMENADLVKRFALAGVEHHRLSYGESAPPGKRGRLVLVARILRALTLLRKVRPQAVELVLPYPDQNLPALVACAIQRIRTMVCFQLAANDLLFSARRCRWYAWARARNQVWVAVSHDNRSKLAKTFDMSESDIEVIHNGVPPVACRPAEHREERQRLLDELQLPPQSRLLLTVGRLDPVKGYVDLIQTIPHIVECHPEVMFLWVGSGPHRERFTRLLTEYGVQAHVRILDWREDVIRLYRAVDLLIHPTQLEGCPFAILEAMASGLPIVTNDLGCIRELLDDGVHGLLARQGDSCSLLKALERALNYPAEMQGMAERALRRSREFSFERMSRQTASILVRPENSRVSK